MFRANKLQNLVIMQESPIKYWLQEQYIIHDINQYLNPQ